jgi:Methyltransferase domain
LLAHWKPVVEPLLDALSPRVVVEVGMARGRTTGRLVEFAAARGCTIHGIDPAPHPELDLEQFRRRLGERFVFHEERSLDVIPRIRDADAVLIDGDHNWYTVHGELTALGEVAADEGRPFPLALLHDVDWPYARRDMYYDPDAIPDAYRQPFRRAGMIPGTSELVDRGGVNPGLNNALHEGGPRNGVRTAIDDFLAEAGPHLFYRDVIGFTGLGIVVDRALLEQHSALEARLAELDSPEWLRAQCARLERWRMDVARRLQEAHEELRALRAPGRG